MTQENLGIGKILKKMFLSGISRDTGISVIYFCFINAILGAIWEIEYNQARI